MASSSQSKIAPGPRGDFLLCNLRAFRRDVLKLLLESRAAYGDVVRFRLGPLLIHLLAHPEHIKHVLLTNQHNYDKSTRSSAKIRSVSGPGLLTSSGDFWLRQRRLTQPAFQPQRLAGFTDIMTEATAAMLERWRNHARTGQPLDVASEMMRLAYTIVGKALFGADVHSDLDAVEQAVAVVLEHTYHRLETILDFPPWFPTPGNLRFRAAMRTLDRIVYRIIRERQSSGADAANLLSMLLERRDEAADEPMSAEQLRNETITLLLAGHETTANALTWTWYLLSQHPDTAERVHAEVNDVLGRRMPTTNDLVNLKYTTMVIRESMRLYPPIWIMERRLLGDDVIDGFTLPRGSTVVLCPYVTHRHPEYWQSPDSFDPDRFSPERSVGRSPNAYIPFGAGQRLCIGNNFALMEAQIILALVAREFHPSLLPGHPVEPKPGITLRIQHGLPMILQPTTS